MIIKAINNQFPGIRIGPGDPLDECVVSDGQIVYWNRPEPQPDLAELLANYDPLPAQRTAALAALQTERERRIDELTGPDRPKQFAQMQATLLLRKMQAGQALSPQEEGLMAALEGIAAMVLSIDAKADLIEDEINAAATPPDPAEIPSNPIWSS